jgi:hypothetical protein
MVICVVCHEEKEKDYCYDCEQIRRKTIKQYKNNKKQPLEASTVQSQKMTKIQF